MSIPGTPPLNEPDNEGFDSQTPSHETDTTPGATMPDPGSPAAQSEVPSERPYGAATSSGPSERPYGPALSGEPYGPAHTTDPYGQPAAPGAWVPHSGAGPSAEPWAPSNEGGGPSGGAPWAHYGPSGYWPGPQPPQMGPQGAAPTQKGKRHRLRNGLLLVALLAGAAAGGVAAGRVSAPSSTASAGASHSTGGSSGGSSGGSALPPGFGGGGGFGGFGVPSTPSGSSGSASPGGSTGVGAGGGSLNASAIAAKVDPGVVDVNVVLGYEDASAAGTGIVLTSNGEILTNNHVVDGATSIRVTDIGNGKTYTGKVVGTDATQDIAVIQLESASGLTTANLGNSSTLKSGEPVLAIGNAGGLGGTPSTAAGSIVALHQSITATDSDGANPEHLTGLVETNAPIQPGDSGGPLVNKAGQVLALDTAASSSSQFQSTSNQAYAIPIDTALSIASQIESGQSSSAIHIGTAGILGVEIEAAGAGEGSSQSGAVIVQILPGSPAASAGLINGDTIVSLNGQAVDSPSALSSLMSSHHPGDRVTVGYDNPSGQLHTVTVTLASGPPA